ncbi:hypothetical protein BGW42_008389 [Actinomortierella wolfii]|nr:hypothetical protein BGW42_008389 [Actinomortierella wolfii]
MSANGNAIILKDRAQALARYPHARIANGMIFVSGISSRRLDNTYEGVKENPDGTFELDIKAQTKAVIENIDVILKSVGASLANIVDLTVFLTNMSDYGAMNEVYNQYFSAETGPSRTCVGVRELPSRERERERDCECMSRLSLRRRRAKEGDLDREVERERERLREREGDWSPDDFDMDRAREYDRERPRCGDLEYDRERDKDRDGEREYDLDLDLDEYEEREDAEYERCRRRR